MQFDGMMQCLALLLHAQGLRLALYKGLHALRQGLYKRWFPGTEPGNHTLRVELTKMLNIP